MHVLVAEDDLRLSRLLERGLRSEGYVVDTAVDGASALALASEGGFDVLILDVLMPQLDGIRVVEELRKSGSRTPILMLTALDSIDDRVRGLDAGADDYLAKPFAFDELLARVRALSRRSEVASQTTLETGAITLDLLRHEVTVQGHGVDLTPTEFRLLEFFLRHPGEVLSRRRLLANVWGYEDEPEANVVDLYVHYLRRRLGEHLPLHTVRGIGYRLDAQPP